MKRSLFYAITGTGDNARPFTFAHKGKDYRLFRRFEDNAKPYYLDFRRTVNGKKTAFGGCLKTNDRELAVKRAKARIDEVDLRLGNEQFGLAPPAAVRPTQPIATLGQLFAAVEKIVGAESAADILAATRRLVRRGQGQPLPTHYTERDFRVMVATVDAQPCSVLTDLLVQHFQRNTLALVPPADPEARRKTLNSILTTVASARRPFSSERLKLLTRPDGDFALHLPNLTGFLEAPLEMPVSVPKIKPPRELLIKTFDAAETELRVKQPNAYIAWLLGTYSMRRGDMARATIHWLQQRDFNDDADFRAPPVTGWCLAWAPHKTSRKGPREVVIRIPDETAGTLRAHWQREQPERDAWERDYLLSSHTRDARGRPRPPHFTPGRCGHLFDTVSAWMRSLGWSADQFAHTLHEMRALYARTATARFAGAWQAGLQHAAQGLGHRKSDLTDKRYVGAMSLHGENTVVRYEGGGK